MQINLTLLAAAQIPITFDARHDGQSDRVYLDLIDVTIEGANGDFGTIQTEHLTDARSTIVGFFLCDAKPGATGTVRVRSKPGAPGAVFEGSAWIQMAGVDARGHCSRAIHITMSQVAEGALEEGNGEDVEEATPPIFEFQVGPPLSDAQYQWLKAIDKRAQRPHTTPDGSRFRPMAYEAGLPDLQPGDAAIDVLHKGEVIGRVVAPTEQGLQDVALMCERIVDEIGMPEVASADPGLPATATTQEADRPHEPEQAILDARAADAKQTPCPKCGQVDTGQTGEYPCTECGLPTTHDEPAKGKAERPPTWQKLRKLRKEAESKTS